eukprot:3261361-Karenia_brevis.AAC.1
MPRRDDSERLAQKLRAVPNETKAGWGAEMFNKSIGDPLDRDLSVEILQEPSEALVYCKGWARAFKNVAAKVVLSVGSNDLRIIAIRSLLQFAIRCTRALDQAR